MLPDSPDVEAVAPGRIVKRRARDPRDEYDAPGKPSKCRTLGEKGVRCLARR